MDSARIIGIGKNTDNGLFFFVFHRYLGENNAKNCIQQKSLILNNL